MADADKEIRVRYVVEGNQALQDYEKIRAKADELKKTLSDLSRQGVNSMKELSVLAKELEKSMSASIKSQRGTGLPKGAAGELTDAQRKELDVLRKGMALAVTEMKTAQTAMTQEVAAQSKQRTTLETQSQKQSAAAIKEYERVTKQGYGVMSSAAQQYGAQVQAVKQQIQQISAQTGQSFQQAGQQLVASGTPIQQVNSALKELNTQTQATTIGFAGLGNVAKYVFGTIFGITIITVLRNIIQWFGKTVEAGQEFVAAMFQLEIGVRAIQRSGVEITIQEVYQNIDRLGKRFGIFSRKELVEGSAALFNLIRDFGFTKEQIFEMQEAIATLAIVNGRAMDDVQRTVALAISSGYTEGLQRLGVSINRVVIAEKAAALGYADNYMALNELQRAEATRILILEKTAKYEQDALIRQERAAGAADKLSTSWQNYTTRLGEALARAAAGFQYMAAELLGLADSADETQKETNFILNLLEEIGNIAAYATKFVVEFWAAATGRESISEALRNLQKFKEEFQKGLGNVEVPETDTERTQQAVSDALEDFEDTEKKSQEQREEYQRDFNNDIEKLERESARRQAEIERDLQRDLAKIDRDGQQDRADLQRDFIKKLADIDAELGRDIAEENAKYTLDVAQTLRQFAIRKAELEARYRENEKKAEIKFQEEMRRLREGFLFDLEDALHERDARQILRLIRQYNLQREQATRQYEIDKGERAREYKLQLEELEAQKNERLRILAEEHAARIAAIQAQAAYERELARQKYEEEKAELERKLQEEKEERLRRFEEQQAELKRKLEEDKEERKILLDQQIEDLEIERDRLLKEIGEKLWGALQTTTTEGLKALYDALLTTLGEDGDAEKVFQYYASAAEASAKSVEGSLTRVAAMLAQLYSFAAGMNSLEGSLQNALPSGSNSTSTTTSTTNTGGGGGHPKRQSGGPVLAGEAYAIHKDETFVPGVNGTILSKQQSQEALINALGRGGRMNSGNGHATIEVMMQPGLVAKIVDDALDQTAEVLISQMRKN